MDNPETLGTYIRYTRHITKTSTTKQQPRKL